MNEKFDFLPLGSIVVVSGGIKKFVIVARALQVNINGCKQFFDYAACPYPEGMNGDRLMYFQHTDISRVVFEGYVDKGFWENPIALQHPLAVSEIVVWDGSLILVISKKSEVVNALIENNTFAQDLEKYNME